MKTCTTFLTALCALIALLALSTAAFAEEEYKGWGAESEFEALYDTWEHDRVKGKFVKFKDITPLDGMAEGIAIEVRNRDDDQIVTGILGPKDYVGMDHMDYPLRKGDKIKLYGAWAEVDGQEMMIATKIKYKDDSQYKVRRTKDGVAYWNMSAEVREAELKASEADEEKMQQE